MTHDKYFLTHCASSFVEKLILTHYCHILAHDTYFDTLCTCFLFILPCAFIFRFSLALLLRLPWIISLCTLRLLALTVRALPIAGRDIANKKSFSFLITIFHFSASFHSRSLRFIKKRGICGISGRSENTFGSSARHLRSTVVGLVKRSTSNFGIVVAQLSDVATVRCDMNEK